MKKYYNIELLRFLFANLIIYFHITHANIMGYVGDNTVYLNMQASSSLSSYVVECFLIISGFFLFISYNNREKTFIDFLFEKIVRLWPVFMVYTLIMVLFFGMDFQDAVLDIFFLRATGISLSYTGIVWYIGPFFYITLLVFALLKYTTKPTSILIISLLAYLSYAINLNVFNGSVGREIVLSFVSTAMLRVLGGICIGVIIAALMEEYVTRFGCASGKEKRFFQLIVSVLEIVAFAILMFLFIYNKNGVKNIFIIVIIFSILLVCIVSENGFISNALNRSFFGKLGRYSYSIYVMQQISFYILEKTFWKNQAFINNHEYLTIIISNFFCVLIGIIVYHLVESPVVRKYKDWNENRQKRINNI